ncbi:MAG: glycosyltransferase [Flavobacteriales bacterium]|jgi:glycosyltransferase involved in cell wall biosynthesis|nr:glycosyltransferase [Flavobacteriales bacterium]
METSPGPRKRILFLSYWSLREPLNASAVFPYLHLLAEREDVEAVHFITLETARGPLPHVDLDIPKVRHKALEPLVRKPHLLGKALLFVRAILQLAMYIRRHRIDLVIAKASIAGGLADLLHTLTGVPYNVESFEPHSDYMVECGVWTKSSVRYKTLNRLERRQLRRARYTITVTHNHKADLVAAGIPEERLHVIPSITDLAQFGHRPADRDRVRAELGIGPRSTVGIYVGKFGGLYFDEEAFRIFARAQAHFPDMHVVVLSPMDPDELRAKARRAGVAMERFHLRVVPHLEVSAYLSSADLAFSPIKPSPIKRYQCPIKNGEYWACGLPIVMTDGISDDHVIMRKGIGGQVFKHDLSDLDQAFAGVARTMARPGYRAEMRALAERYRSLELAREVYRTVV